MLNAKCWYTWRRRQLMFVVVGRMHYFVLFHHNSKNVNVLLDAQYACVALEWLTLSWNHFQPENFTWFSSFARFFSVSFSRNPVAWIIMHAGYWYKKLNKIKLSNTFVTMSRRATTSQDSKNELVIFIFIMIQSISFFFLFRRLLILYHSIEWNNQVIIRCATNHLLLHYLFYRLRGQNVSVCNEDTLPDLSWGKATIWWFRL